MAFSIGIVDFDSSHCVEFTRRINHSEIEPEQWVDGARVVVGCPGTSILSPERLPRFTEEMTQLGVPLVREPQEMIGRVDGVMVLSVDGSVHWERARPFIEAGVPCFVDKPFTCSLPEAREMVQAARRHATPLFSCSALRYAPELVEFLNTVEDPDSPLGPIVGAITYGPSATRARNPRLFHYGLHSIEALFALMGPACESVLCTHEAGEAGTDEVGVEVATGRWSGGRMGTVRGIRTGHRSFGLVAFCERGIRHVTMDMQFVYRELLKRVIGFFQSRKTPVELDETLRIISFIEAARRSTPNGGMTRLEP
jgi:virulence factor